ncbi:radical SAM protein [Clostridium sporogenes]|uniref:radical SAM protein n=1 Tax=Clostridium sporogenes TaxID=1509 RepID=UPI0006B26FD3|nr:radical SAM protein [Clostridium sporogenes]KOY67414.1 hypothetical protein AN649_03260 [Clostridium sporogenes]MDU1421149.1 radical SAM protein [Clostridium botulinum]
MNELKFVFGPVPSRRLGKSLGISAIPKKTCNYSCIYCQLGRTNKLSNNRMEFFRVFEIIDEFKNCLKKEIEFDAITLVGEGEPTLYLKMGDLISEIKKLTYKPVVVITNGALLYNKNVQNELGKADIVLPSLDAYDEDTFRRINNLVSSGVFSEIIDDYKAVLSIIRRHPMNQFEIISFLNSRKCKNINNIFQRLNEDDTVNHINYKGFITYRLK